MKKNHYFDEFQLFIKFLYIFIQNLNSFLGNRWIFFCCCFWYNYKKNLDNYFFFHFLFSFKSHFTPKPKNKINYTKWLGWIKTGGMSLWFRWKRFSKCLHLPYLMIYVSFWISLAQIKDFQRLQDVYNN
jgi:hypothetical protein